MFSTLKTREDTLTLIKTILTKLTKIAKIDNAEKL